MHASVVQESFEFVVSDPSAYVSFYVKDQEDMQQNRCACADKSARALARLLTSAALQCWESANSRFRHSRPTCWCSWTCR